MTTNRGGSGNSTSISRPFEKQHVKDLQPGAILWLPNREGMPEGVYVDPDIQDGAFNHPCVVLSVPSQVNIKSIIEIAYVCYFPLSILTISIYIVIHHHISNTLRNFILE